MSLKKMYVNFLRTIHEQMFLHLHCTFISHKVRICKLDKAERATTYDKDEDKYKLFSCVDIICNAQSKYCVIFPLFMLYT